MALHVFRHINELRQALAEQRMAGKRIACVPTMGNLHEGHLELIKLAKQHADIVVATIFVNRLQFGLNEDWDQYPRTFSADCEKLEREGCEYLFFPEEVEMYPNGMDGQTRVIVPTMTDVLCGASRPGHFEGVTTVVSKLLNIVDPDVAVFGQKDYQQLAVIQRMLADLCSSVQIVEAPIARDHDGLALSSRNAYIEADERLRVTVLHDTLEWAKAEVLAGRQDYRQLEQQAAQRIEDKGFRLDYFSISEANTLQPAVDDDHDLAILGAMFTAGARLIDNVTLQLS